MISGRTALGLVFVCLVYAATLVATIPAPWVSRAIERASNQELLLRDPAGTAWAGSGSLYARLRSGELLDLGRLRWSSSPASIFRGHLAADLALGANAKTTRVELSPSALNVRGLSLELPGQILAQFAPALGAIGPEGKLLLRSDSLRIEAGSILGLGAIEWRGVRLARVSGVDFGSHVARLRGGGDKVNIEFGTIEGPTRLSGGGTWTPNDGLKLSGTFEPGNSPPAMTTFLQGVCSDYRSGRCSFRFPG
jgi:general secretion pathway protein N